MQEQVIQTWRCISVVITLKRKKTHLNTNSHCDIVSSQFCIKHAGKVLSAWSEKFCALTVNEDCVLRRQWSWMRMKNWLPLAAIAWFNNTHIITCSK